MAETRNDYAFYSMDHRPWKVSVIKRNFNANVSLQKITTAKKLSLSNS